MGQKGGHLSIKLLWILQKACNRPNPKPRGFSFLYSVSKITWDLLNCFMRSIICFSMLIKKFKCFLLAIQISGNLLESDISHFL